MAKVHVIRQNLHISMTWVKRRNPCCGLLKLELITHDKFNINMKIYSKAHYKYILCFAT